MTDQNNYYKYLKNRSYIGFLYRKYWLYPRLNYYLVGKVLDVGCGIGDFLSYRKNSIGTDINHKMVEWCCSQGHQAVSMGLDELPFENESFDSVIMDNVLEHIKNPEAILREVNRVLVEKGVFLIGVPGSLGYSRDDDHKVFYSEDELVKTLNKNGFKELKIFAMPVNLKLFDKYLSQYCVYGVFIRSDLAFDVEFE
ncbi:class I SAM-dependent methyltransferase [Candidatus Thioglobus sp.]|nr:class I SAM-dependent methyltransferase [Candidatus Thioglobus sp.]